MGHDLKINPRIAQWAVLQAARVMCLFAILQGLNIIFSDIDRWGADSFVYVMAVPGAPPTWGYVLVFGGALATVGGIFGKFWIITAGCWVCCTWSLFFSSVFLKAAIDDAQASSLGFITYLGIALLFAGLAAVFNTSRKVNNAAERGNA